MSATTEPDLEHVASRITDRTKALVIINPNNPTGAVYSRETMLGLLDLARKHGLLVLTDEIYDQIIYDGAVHHSAAALAPDLLVLTLGGLSKTYRLACSSRSGWLVVSGPREHAADYLDGLELLANMAPVPERSRSARNRARARRPDRHHPPARARRAACATSVTMPGRRSPPCPVSAATSPPARCTCSRVSTRPCTRSATTSR